MAGRWKCVASVSTALCLTLGAAHAAPTIWLTDDAQRIGKVDVATGAVSGIVTTGQTFTDIAFDPAGTLWGITFTQLFTINPSTGASVLVGGLNAPENLNSLTFGLDGTLWAAGSNLYTVNKTTGAANSLGNAGTSYSSAGDLAFVGGLLYLSTNSNQLVRLNTTSGAATTVGSFGVTQVYGLATPDNALLYGVRSNQVFSVNPATGVGSAFVSYSGQGLGIAYGSAFQTEASPVPEPASFAMFLAGIGVIVLTARRRFRDHP